MTDEEHTRVWSWFRRWKELGLVHPPTEDLASTSRLRVKSQNAFQRTADGQVEVGQSEGIATELPSLMTLSQGRVHSATLRSHCARNMVSFGCANSGPRTDAPRVCMDNRDR